MKNTKRVAVAFSIIATLTFLLTLFLVTTMRHVTTDIESLNILALLRAEISRRAIIADTYILYRDKSIVSQLNDSNISMTQLLRETEEIFTDPDQSVLVRKIVDGDVILRQTDAILFAPNTTESEENEAFKGALKTREEMLNNGAELSALFRVHFAWHFRSAVVAILLTLTLLVYASFLNLTWIKRMIAKLNNTNEELDTANAEMSEAQKAQEALNRELQSNTELMKKTEEKLKEKISELERFNKLTVDRELKMIELKKGLADARKNI